MMDNPTLSAMREIERSPYGERLFEARTKHAKISQKDLADAAGTSQSTVAELEKTGKGSSYTAQFAARLGVRVAWLATAQGPMVEPKTDNAPQPGATAGVAAGAPTLAAAMETLGKAIESADAGTREDVLGMLTLFVRNPKANAGQLPLLVERLSGESRGPTNQLSAKSA